MRVCDAALLLEIDPEGAWALGIGSVGRKIFVDPLSLSTSRVYERTAPPRAPYHFRVMTVNEAIAISARYLRCYSCSVARLLVLWQHERGLCSALARSIVREAVANSFSGHTDPFKRRMPQKKERKVKNGENRK